MNAQLRKLRAAALALLLLLPSLFATAQTPVSKVGKVLTDYGLESDMRIPSEVMRRTITTLPPGIRVTQILKDLGLFPQAGGIMFDAPAQPCEKLANAQLRLSYNKAKPDGQRLTLFAGKKAYTVSGIYDRDLIPIAEFVDDKIPVLTNVQYPDEALSQSCPSPPGLRIVTLHKDLRDTRLGGLLIDMDSVPWSFSRGERWNSNAAPPQATLNLSRSLKSALLEDELTYSELWPDVRLEFINSGQRVLRSLDRNQKEHYADRAQTYSDAFWQKAESDILANPDIDKAAWNRLGVEDRRILYLFINALRSVRVSNINDDKAAPSFCTQTAGVRLDGTPQLLFVAPRYGTNHVLTGSSALMTENISQLRLVDQAAYDGLITTYRLGGLFRYVEQQSPLPWKQFLRSLPPKEKRDTYTIICPDCKKADVEKWLTCVEGRFPSAN
jgi:hypothetical protein